MFLSPGALILSVETFSEKMKKMAEKIIVLEMIGEDESGEKILERYNKVVNEFEKAKMNGHSRYLLGIILIEGLEESRKIMDRVKFRFIEVVENNGRMPKEEKIVIDDLKRNIIEGRR